MNCFRDAWLTRIWRKDLVRKPMLAAAVLLLLLFANPPALRAQIDTGSVSGTVTDQQSAVVPGARVEIRNEATGYTDAQPSKQNGTYNFPTVRIGDYVVTVTANGFRKQIHEHVTVAIQQQVVLSFQMQLASTSSTVEVTTGQSTLQTENASVSQIVGTEEINSLPLNGRNYTLLAQLAPGTTTTVYDSGHGEVESGTFTANGLITTFNNYMLDGISDNNDTADWGNGTSYAIKPPPDALEEFKVETANYSAEYGRSGGAVVNAVTRSGQNRFYGDLWEYNRNSFFDSNDYFLNAARQPRPAYNRNQYGFSLGGPIVHDKTFFFMDYEGIRLKQGEAYTSTVPTALQRSSGFTNFSELISFQKGTQTDILGRTTPVGTIFDPASTRYLSSGTVDPVTGKAATSTGYVRDPFAGNIIPAGRISPVATKLLSLFPAPNTGAGITNNYADAPLLLQNSDAFDVRVDQNFSSKDQLFARGSYALQPYTIPPPCAAPANCGNSATVGTQNTNIEDFAVGETHIFSPNLVNEFRVGYNRIHMDRVQPFGTQAGLNQQYGIPGIPDAAPNGGLAQIKITGYAELGSHNNVPLDEIGSESQYNDSVSLVKGKHSMRFGGEFERIKDAINSGQFPHGEFVFGGNFTDQPNGNAASTGPAQFVIEPENSTVANCAVLSNTQGPPGPGCFTYNFVGGANQIQASPLSQEDFRWPYFGTYFTDTWKILPRLTLDLGLRYEYFAAYSDHAGRGSNFVPSFASKNGQSQFLIDDRAKNIPLSPSFVNLLAAQNIALTYTGNHGLRHLSPWNFGPRIGLSLQLTQRAVLRAGYGIFYAGIYARGDGYNIGNNYPFAFAVNVTPTTAAGLSNDGSIGGIDKGMAAVPLNPSVVVGSQISPRGLQYYARVPDAQDMNLTLQYQLTNRQYFEIGYVGTQSRHVESNIESNRPSVLLPPVLPAGTTLATYLPYPGLPTAGYYTWNEGSNNYNSLQVKYEKLLGQGVNLIADYTWSKFLGYGSDSNLFSSLGYRAPFVPGFGMKGEYGNMDFESANVIHMGGGWQLPFGKGRRWLNHGAVVDAVAGGWNLQGIFTYQSGQPVTISCSVTTDTASGCYALVNKGAIFQGAHTLQHWFNAAAFSNPAPATMVGQSDLSPLGGAPAQAFGPAFHRGDLGVQKIFHLPGTHELEVRGEAFNLTNTPNFGQPGTLNPSSSAFASITNTRDSPSDAREFQFAVKYLFGNGHQE
ncbi:TonB-dependent receptor [Paracidobacterium acidisoli]|nr:carboxypeptidase-like regulatory domain-containing protein [Paracidobacterium acidisoli]MBT9331555.1 carboxypeptidase-like regulatory domain-containing protein [Paracidobacterium acidisoli]